MSAEDIDPGSHMHSAISANGNDHPYTGVRAALVGCLSHIRQAMTWRCAILVVTDNEPAFRLPGGSLDGERLSPKAAWLKVRCLKRRSALGGCMDRGFRAPRQINQ